MPEEKLLFVIFIYLLLSLIIIYDSISSGYSTLYILKSFLTLGIWLTPSFIVMHYSEKLLSPRIGEIAKTVAEILVSLVLMFTYVVVYYLSLSIGPIFLVKGKSLFESIKPLLFVCGFMILTGVVHALYKVWKKNSAMQGM